MARTSGYDTRCKAFLADRQSSNPALQYGQFQSARRTDRWNDDGWGRDRLGMTLNGTLGKTAILLLIAACSAGYMWQNFAAQLGAATSRGAIVALKGSLSQTATLSGIAGLVTAMATIFKPNWAPWSAPLYAAFKGAVLGALSFQFEAMFPGLVQNAVLVTFGTAGGMLAAYTTGMITVSDRLRSIITTAVIGVMMAYFGSMLLGLFGVHLSFLSRGMTGLVFAGFTAVVAASCLLLDFDSVQRMEYSGMPKWMEWYGGFTIMVTLAWLYTEVLRFLAILAGNQARD